MKDAPSIRLLTALGAELEDIRHRLMLMELNVQQINKQLRGE